MTYQQTLTNWVKNQLNSQEVGVSELTGDASFRTFYRCNLNNQSYIAFNSPPNQEDNESLIKFTDLYHSQGLKVPKIYAKDLQKGFFLIEDFGDDLFITKLNHDSMIALYKKAIDNLLVLQKTKVSFEMKVFDENEIKRELNLFIDWFLQKEVKKRLSKEDTSLIEQTFNILIKELTNQPRVFVHKDYHSRNLMMLSNNKIGILDYQDSLIGPISYDLVSLLKDCYTVCPKQEMNTLIKYYLSNAIEHKILQDVGFELYRRWFDFSGIQRHIKVLGIFSRLYHRDGKNGYLGDLPRVYNYLINATSEYKEFSDFHKWLTQNINPYFGKKIT